VSAESLSSLCERLRASKGMQHKGDIALAHRGIGTSELCPVGDDCAAIPDGDGYSLFAIEGLLDEFVRAEPWFAGYCAVMVNISDVAAMGGRPTAVVDALWTSGGESASTIFEGMLAASKAYGVPIVGGHTNARSDGDRLAVAVLGRARALLTSFDARAGDELLMAVDLRGAYQEPYSYWNCSTTAPGERLRGDLELLPEIAELGLCAAAKDISMGGVLGTLLMLLECSRIGARIDLARVPKPAGAELERWLQTFPSFGFLLAAQPTQVAAIRERFEARGIACVAIGACTERRALEVVRGSESEIFWDLETSAFTGAGRPSARGVAHG
jgi:AIR synthase-related protein